MAMFCLGLAVGWVSLILIYHFHILKQLKVWAVDWRARARSAEQEVENWKVWAKTKGWGDPFRK